MILCGGLLTALLASTADTRAAACAVARQSAACSKLEALDGAGPAERRELLELLRREGRARHLSVLFAAAGLPPLGRKGAWMRERPRLVEEALVEVLGRDGRSVRVLLELTERVPGDLHEVVARAARRALGARVIELFPRLLEAGPGFERAVIAELSNLDTATQAYERRRLAALARPRLAATDPVLRALAAAAAGDLRDEEALPQLLLLLEDDAPEVARKAAWALARIAGEDHGGSTLAWRRWYQEQHGFWQDHAPELLERVRGRDEEATLAALSILEQHVVYRHPLSRALVPELWSRSERVASGVADALGVLASPESLPDLVDALERPELLIRNAAWRALRAISGLDLMLEERPWREMLLR